MQVTKTNPATAGDASPKKKRKKVAVKWSATELFGLYEAGKPIDNAITALGRSLKGGSLPASERVEIQKQLETLSATLTKWAKKLKGIKGMEVARHKDTGRRFNADELGSYMLMGYRQESVSPSKLEVIV